MPQWNKINIWKKKKQKKIKKKKKKKSFFTKKAGNLANMWPIKLVCPEMSTEAQRLTVAIDRQSCFHASLPSFL